VFDANPLRRPGLEPGRIRHGLSMKTLASDTFRNHIRRGVRVPAFAGLSYKTPSSVIARQRVGRTAAR
jgi:hypothetical protein